MHGATGFCVSHCEESGASPWEALEAIRAGTLKLAHTKYYVDESNLSIQTSGYRGADLDKALPILHDLAETFKLEFLGDVSDDHLRHLAGLRNILSLKVNRRQVTDAGLRHLASLTSLRVLELSGLPVTAAGVRHLAGLTNLCEMHLGWTQADDGSVEALSGLPRRTKLDLSSCPITDHCMKHLVRLTTLQSLTLSGTKIQGPGWPRWSVSATWRA